MLNLYPYSNSFSKLFQQEKQKLQGIFGPKNIIEHIGSTAIPGIDGKGVIDIMLVFNNKDEIDTAMKILLENGYYLAKNEKDRGDRIFMSSAGERESTLGDIHLHLTKKGEDAFKNALLFRDFLITHSTKKQEYINLKYKIQKKAGDDRAKYTRMKSRFIKKIIGLAKKEISSVP